MGKERYDVILIVLTYINSGDLQDMINSIHKNALDFRYKVIVVNSFYDTISQKKIECISKKNNCDFLNIENKGYGYGNDKGIDYAKNKYEFDYLIISNPDILIKRISLEELEKYSNSIIGPSIIRKNGSQQNPAVLFPIPFLVKLKYWGFKYSKIFLYIFIIANKIIKVFFKRNNVQRTYMLHGSFLIIPKIVLNQMGQIFDEQMFLFNEEDLLAYKCKYVYNIQQIYNPNIKVLHKEDGSINLANMKTFAYSKASYIYFFERYYSR